jgi:hypothetical protein
MKPHGNIRLGREMNNDFMASHIFGNHILKILPKVVETRVRTQVLKKGCMARRYLIEAGYGVALC